MNKIGNFWPRIARVYGVATLLLFALRSVRKQRRPWAWLVVSPYWVGRR